MTWHNTILLPKKKKKSRLPSALQSCFQGCNPRSSSGSPLSQYLYGPGGATGPPGPSHVNAAGGGNGPPSDPLVASPPPAPPPPPPAHVGKLRCTGKKGTNCCCFQSSFSFLLSSTGLRSPLYSLSHTQYPYSMLGAADQLAAWYDDYYTFSNLFTFFIISSSNRLMEKAEILYLGEKST